MGGAATAKDRQAALRAKRSQDGLKYIHVWTRPDQEQAIKAFLAAPAAHPLHVTHEPLDAAIDEELTKLRYDLVQQQFELQQRSQELAMKEIQLEGQRRSQDAFEADLARREQSAEDTYQTCHAWLGDLEKRRDAIKERERELNVLEKNLKVAGARLKRDGDSKKVTDKTRTETLVKRFTTERDYSKGSEVAYKAIVDDWKIEQRVKEVAKLTSRTKSVRTSMAKLASEFKDILGDREVDDLMDAHEVLYHISHAADIALKRARTLESKLKEEEKQRQALAYKAATTYLQGLGDAEQVMRLCILDPHSYYELDRFLAGEGGYLSDVKRHTHSAVVYKIKDALKAGQNLEQALASLESLVAERMPKAKAKAKDTFGRRIEVAIAAVIAARLTKATGA